MFDDWRRLREDTVVAPWTFSYKPNPKIDMPHGCAERDRGFTMKTPDIEPRLHQGIVELVKIP